MRYLLKIFNEIVNNKELLKLTGRDKRSCVKRCVVVSGGKWKIFLWAMLAWKIP